MTESEQLAAGEAFSQLAHWYAQPLGAMLAQEIFNRLAPHMASMFGYHLLQIGNVCGNLSQGRTSIRHCIHMAPVVPADVIALPEAVPLATDSVDVVILPHTLEIDPRPHQVLREVERILIPEGHVVIVGFNPWSLFGVWRWRPSLRKQMPWAGHFFSVARMRDWLSLLDFEVTQTEFFSYRPPLRNGALWRKLRFFEQLGMRFFNQNGGMYIIVARKRIATLTPIRRPRAAKRPVLAPGYANHGG